MLSGYEPRPSSREFQLIEKWTKGRWEMGDISEMGTAVPKRPDCVKITTRVWQDRKPEDKSTLPAYLKHSHMAKRRYTTIDGSVPSFRHMRMFEIGRQGGFVLRLAIRDSTESSSLSLVCPRVRSVSNFILVSCILTSSFLIHVVRNVSVARSVPVRFTGACPDCARVFSAV